MPTRPQSRLQSAAAASTMAHRDPDVSFWTDDLEFPAPHFTRHFAEDEQREQWVDRLNTRHLEIICSALGLDDVPVRQRKAAVLGYAERLAPYHLVQAFGRSVHKHAVRDVAKRVLPQAVVGASLINQDEDRYDKTALLFSLFQADPNHLRTVFHMDKVQRHSFARMVIGNPPARPAADFRSWFTQEQAEELLKSIDADKGDEMTSELRDIVPWDESTFVFIRRGFGQGHVLNDAGRVVHGYTPEWIVLHFSRGADHVRISSKSISTPLIIANRLASAYYGQTVTYDNQVEKTYTNQINYFMGQMVTAEPADVTLLEVSVSASPLRGGAKVRLGSGSSSSLRQSIQHFDQAVPGGLMRNIPAIEGIKLGFRNKRLSVRFDQEAGEVNEFIVRYSEHRLSMTERVAFEDEMKGTYEITAISSERRFVNSPV